MKLNNCSWDGLHLAQLSIQIRRYHHVCTSTAIMWPTTSRPKETRPASYGNVRAATWLLRYGSEETDEYRSENET
ncbi:unnamed protein product [Ceratitis capitata]|uniref:(Mediterranean fruit fly) hypothetical protein n=1 Tax=Ceratitis capitata TaxID=7213 RepID=A0A811UFU1_CERCA|nr:unnamed protein product [Ceratitis capitata]